MLLKMRIGGFIFFYGLLEDVSISVDSMAKQLSREKNYENCFGRFFIFVFIGRSSVRVLGEL